MGRIELNELLAVTGLKASTLRKYIGLRLIGRPHVSRNGPGRVVSTYPEDTLYRLGRIEELKGFGLTLKEMVTDMRIVESPVTSRWVEFRVMQSQVEGKGVTVQESEDALELAVGRMHEDFVELINGCIQEVRNEKKEET